ncbi:hypothetical protein FQA39_LY11195 [Lamprigera yunnana]|nr:hypothetical protein FQA39_LY11195 [Lamprigera yunnana]
MDSYQPVEQVGFHKGYNTSENLPFASCFFRLRKGFRQCSQWAVERAMNNYRIDLRYRNLLHNTYKNATTIQAEENTNSSQLKEVVNNWLVSNSGIPSSTACCRSASVKKAVSAFTMCGIFPVGPEMFTDEDCAPCAVTDIELETQSPTETDTQINYGPVHAVPSTSGTQHGQPDSTALLYQYYSYSDSDYEPDVGGLLSPRAVAKSVSPADIGPLPKSKNPQRGRKKVSSPFRNNLQTKAEENVEGNPSHRNCKDI